MIIKKEAILAGDQSQFAVLLRTHYLSGSDTGKEISTTERSALAAALLSKTLVIDWSAVDVKLLFADMDKKLGVQSALFKAEVCFSLDAVQYFSRSLQLHTELHHIQYKMNTVILAHAVSDAQFWWQDNACKKLVNFVSDQMLGWEPEFGNTSQAVQQLFTKTIDKLFAIPLCDNEAMDRFYQAVIVDFHQLLDKFSRLANRLKDSEIGIIKANRCKTLATAFVNKTTKEQLLPAYITNFLQNKFINEMQLLLIKHGEDSTLWVRWKKMVETLVKYYQPGVSAEGDAGSLNILFNLSGEIEKLVEESIPMSNVFQDFCNEVAYDFSRKAIGNAIDGLAIVSPLVVAGEVPGIEKKVTQALLGKAKAFDVGQWFIYKDEAGKEYRCKLLLGVPEYNQILFVSLVGQKALLIDYEKFAYLLSAKHMIPLVQLHHMQQASMHVIDKLLENFTALYEAKKSAQKQKAMQIELVKQQNEKRLAADKARAEAEAIAQRKAIEAEEIAQQKAAEAQAIAQKRSAAEQSAKFAKMADDMKRQSRLAINSLALGSWVDFLDDKTNTFKRVKLAVKYNATGRFVFVDADGATALDYQRDELLELMMKRKLKLLDSDGEFADRLASIVKNIRKVE